MPRVSAFVDGKATGSNTSKRPNGKILVSSRKLPMIIFLTIDCQIPQIDINVLRKDQQYLLDILKAIKSGACKEDLVVRDLGHLSHSSWLKKGNRTPKLFISEESPSP